MTMKSGYLNTPVRPRADVVYLLDDRGWYYRYSHLFTIDPAMKLGAKVKMGQHLGVLGKEGASGGWSHLHFGITCRQPSGKWGTQEAYAFAWETWVRENEPSLIAVARPHHFVRVGESLTLDAGKSWSASGKIQNYHWTFTDGGAADGVTVERKYDKPGAYSEILKITDDAGHVAYDFAIVQVIGSLDPKELPAAIHPSFFPTMNIAPGQPVTFKVRTFRDAGGETWDFGDGSPARCSAVRRQCRSARQGWLCHYRARVCQDWRLHCSGRAYRWPRRKGDRPFMGPDWAVIQCKGHALMDEPLTMIILSPSPGTPGAVGVRVFLSKRQEKALSLTRSRSTGRGDWKCNSAMGCASA